MQAELSVVNLPPDRLVEELEMKKGFI